MTPEGQYLIRVDTVFQVVDNVQLLELAKKSRKPIEAFKITSWKKVTAEPIVTARITSESRRTGAQ